MRVSPVLVKKKTWKMFFTYSFCFFCFASITPSLSPLKKIFLRGERRWESFFLFPKKSCLFFTSIRFPSLSSSSSTFLFPSLSFCGRGRREPLMVYVDARLSRCLPLLSLERERERERKWRKWRKDGIPLGHRERLSFLLPHPVHWKAVLSPPPLTLRDVMDVAKVVVQSY